MLNFRCQSLKRREQFHAPLNCKNNGAEIMTATMTSVYLKFGKFANILLFMMNDGRALDSYKCHFSFVLLDNIFREKNSVLQ